MIKFQSWFNQNWEALVTNIVLDSKDFTRNQMYKIWEYISKSNECSEERTKRLFSKWYNKEETKSALCGKSLQDQASSAWHAASAALKVSKR